MEPDDTQEIPGRYGVYAWSPGTGGVHHHRIAEPLRVLAELGYVAHSGVELHDEILAGVDTVLAHTLHTPDATEAWQRLAELGTHRLVLDVDDAMWRPDWTPFKANYTPEVLDRLYANIRAAHVVTCPTGPLAEYLVKFNSNVWVVPNTVPAWLLDHTMPPREAPTVGYQGSPSHARDWTPTQVKQLARFLVEHPEWRLHLWGSRPGGFGDWSQVGWTPWQGNVADYYGSLSMDVMVGPLAPTYFNRCKSGLRAIEAAALGIVAVLPDLTPYRGWVEDGVTGVLVHPWQTLRGVLREVAAQPDWRAKMAANARERAASWTTEASIGRWIEAWNSR